MTWLLDKNKKDSDNKVNYENGKGAKSFLILGLGFFGAELAVKLYELGAEVLAVDSNPQIIARIADKVTQAIELDPADDQALESLDVSQYDVCVIARGSNLEDSVSIAISLRQLGAKRIIGRTVRRKHSEILRKLGVEETIFPEVMVADHIAEKLVRPKIHDKMDFENGFVVETLFVLGNLEGLTHLELLKKIPKGVQLLGIKRDEDMITDFENCNITLQENDFIVVYGKTERIRELEK